MPTTDTNSGIARELGEAIDELHVALQHASDATAKVRALVPRIGTLGTLFDDIEAVLKSGRQQFGAESHVAQTPAQFPRPTLVPPAPAVAPERAPAPAPAPAPAEQPQLRVDAPPSPPPASKPKASTASAKKASIESAVATAEYEPLPTPAISDPQPAIVEPAENRVEELICFRLEFESRPGPLDLRTVDDAVSEHPAVRDVALLDYDGRKATLKVWITSLASPADVQQSLSDRAGKIFASGNDVTIVALEDVA